MHKVKCKNSFGIKGINSEEYDEEFNRHLRRTKRFKRLMTDNEKSATHDSNLKKELGLGLDKTA